MAGVRDRDLFSKMLREGERSALFISSSQVQKHYGNHRVYFYYLMVEDEVARVEIPEWVAVSPALLDMSHSLIFDQCKRVVG